MAICDSVLGGCQPFVARSTKSALVSGHADAFYQCSSLTSVSAPLVTSIASSECRLAAPASGCREQVCTTPTQKGSTRRTGFAVTWPPTHRKPPGGSKPRSGEKSCNVIVLNYQNSVF